MKEFQEIANLIVGMSCIHQLDKLKILDKPNSK